MASSSSVRPPIFDSKLVSTPADLSGVQQTYTKASMEKIPYTSGNPSQWGPGSTVTYTSPQFSDSVWDLAETQLNMRCRVHVDFDHTPAGGPTTHYSLPLSGYSTAAVEKYFLSGLCEQINISYGDSEVKSFEGAPYLFPTLHALYSTVNCDNDKVVGEAICGNLAGIASVPTAIDDVKASYRDEREWGVVQDACLPFNICQSADEANLPRRRALGGQTELPFDSQLTVANFTYFKPFIAGQGHQYRSMLILDTKNTTTLAPGVPNPAFNDGSLNIAMKFAHPLFDKNKEGFKTPANLALRITLRRSRDVSYQFMGNALTDALLSTGIGPIPDEFSNATYRLYIDEMDMYMKRLVLSETARTVLYQTPSLVWEQPIWNATEYDLTSNQITQAVANVKAPECVWVALVPKAHLRPVAPAAGQHFEKYVSVYNTADRADINFRSLYLNTAKGQIPEVRYEPAFDSGSVNVAQSMRAYHEFKKSFKNPESCPIPFRTWLNGYQWYAFIVNNDSENPHDETNMSERSNIVVNAVLQLPAGVVEADVRAAHSLVVVTMESGLVVDDNLKSVAVLY